MKFVILSKKIIPGYGVKGPILSPATYDIHQVLKWVAAGVDVREVMEDGSFRKLSFNDERLINELNKKLEKQAIEKEEIKKQREGLNIEPVKRANVSLVPEKKLPQKKVVKKQEVVKEELKVEKVEEQKVEPEKIDLIIDELEKPE